jgi:hypothetical protein
MSQDTVLEQALPVPPPSPRQVALGLFVLFQLAFLIVSNVLGLIESGVAELKDDQKKLVNRLAPGFASEEGHGWAWCDRIETGTRRWMQLTGQDQDWYLFAPSASKVTGVPVVLLLWDEPPPSGPSIKGSKLEYDAQNGFNLIIAPGQLAESAVWLPSENAPTDEKSYVKIGKARIRRYEGLFYMDALPNKDEPREEAEGRLTRRMRRLLTDAHDPVLHYLQWRLKAWQRLHPDTPPPRQVLLCERFYRIHDPDEEPRGWDGPFLVPQARWLPEAQPAEGNYVIEPFDFSEQRFKPMAR